MPKKKIKKSKIKAKKAVKIKKTPRRGAVKKASRKKAAAKKSSSTKPVIAGISLTKIGEVTHYFPQVRAAAVLIKKDSLKVGDEIYIKGHTTDFKETVNSIQLDRVPIEEGKKGKEIGLLVKSRVRIGDTVYKIKPSAALGVYTERSRSIKK